MSNVEAVVFDIGNVLVGWQPERVYDRLIGPARRQALFDEVDLEGMNAQVDRGALLAESVNALAKAHPHWAEEIRLWQVHWDDMFAPVIDETVALLKAFKAQGMPVFALSNFGAETFARARARHDFLDAFDAAFISGHLGVLKPEPEIYAALEKATGLAGDKIFFIDDRADNIAAARARGWQAHHFTGPAALRQDLVASGVLS